jgi:hypothetical protein
MHSSLIRLVSRALGIISATSSFGGQTIRLPEPTWRPASKSFKEAVALRAGSLPSPPTRLCGLGARGKQNPLAQKGADPPSAGDISGLALTLSNLGGALTQLESMRRPGGSARELAPLR